MNGGVALSYLENSGIDDGFAYRSPATTPRMKQKVKLGRSR